MTLIILLVNFVKQIVYASKPMKEHFSIDNAYKILSFVSESSGVYATIDPDSEVIGFVNPKLNLETARILEEGGFLEGTILVRGGVAVQRAIVRLTNKGNELFQILDDRFLRDKLKDMTIETAYEVGKGVILSNARLTV